MSRRFASLTSLFLLLGLVPLLATASGAVADDPPPDDKAFADLTPERIAAALKAAKAAGDPINGSDTKDNKLTDGTILVYRTGEGRYGKLKVVKYGRDLTVNWVTYERDGTVAAKVDKHTIRGTYTADLDSAKPEEKTDREKADLWWEQKGFTTRFLVPKNKATVAVYDPKK